MKMLKRLLHLSVLLSVLFISCKKQEESEQPVLIGMYEFSLNDNFEINKWGEGGGALTLSDSELSIYVRPNWNLFPGKYKYVFTSDFKMIFTDSNGVYLDTIKYKITNNIVYLDVRELELFGMDYMPMFKVSGTDLYNTFKGTSYKTDWLQSGEGIVEFEETNLLDSALKTLGYSSLTQLKANEEVTLFKFRINYTKK